MHIPLPWRLCALALGCCVASTASAQVRYYPAGNGMPFSSAVQVDNVLHLSGMIGTTADGAPIADMEGQAKAVMNRIRQSLTTFGLTMDDVFECTIFLADMQQWQAFNRVYVTYFKPDRLPTRSALGANGLALGALAEVQCNAYRPAAAAR